jgi:hypothetical protein
MWQLVAQSFLSLNKGKKITLTWSEILGAYYV